MTTARLLRLPNRGRLLVCTDLQGHFADFRAMAEIFERAVREQPETHVIFAGDLVHGPSLAEADWGPWLGDYYRDDSIAVFEGFERLTATYSGRVHALLGNHEHAHIGGARTAKFFPDEAAALEARMGHDTTARFRAWCRGLPLVAASASGVIVTHASPAAEIEAPEDLDVSYDVAPPTPSIEQMTRVPVLGPLLWARSAKAATARRLIKALVGRESGFVVFGHDAVREGYEIAGDGEQLCLSTSFGLYDAHKRYLSLDLSRRWESARELRDGVELLPLYPNAPARPVWGRDFV